MLFGGNLELWQLLYNRVLCWKVTFAFIWVFMSHSALGLKKYFNPQKLWPRQESRIEALRSYIPGME